MTTFSDIQTRQLKAKLDEKHVKTRVVDGTSVHYVEGWYAIAEANRIFGYDAWDRRTMSARCVWTSSTVTKFQAAYVAKVRIRVRAGDITITRDGSGTGEGTALTAGQAHDLALKSAETDATKRALTTFGNAFGLALYDADQSGVRRRGNKDKNVDSGPWLLHATDGSVSGSFTTISSFAEALRNILTSAPDIESLFELWERNVATVRGLSRRADEHGESRMAKTLVEHFKSCARSIGNSPQTKIDKSVLTISEPKRIRSKEHLRFVASQPCLICGRSPAHAHHLRFAQAKGVGLKVSDEFTVPLCATHHSENHRTGSETNWWEAYKIEPLSIAHQLWTRFQQRHVAPTIAAEPSAQDLRGDRS